MYADHLLLPWVEALPVVRLLRRAHAHRRERPRRLRRSPRRSCSRRSRSSDARAVVFTMHEPDGYPDGERPRHRRGRGVRRAGSCRSAASIRTPTAPREAERCLARGARGIKLHPRAERFTLDHPEVERLCAIADERRLPILVHAGRGIPALGRHAYDLTGRYPELRLILAHAGVSDLGLALAARRRAAEPPLRHVVVDDGGLRRALRARAAGTDPDGERRALRHAGDGRALRDAVRAAGRPLAGAARVCRRPAARACARG